MFRRKIAGARKCRYVRYCTVHIIVYDQDDTWRIDKNGLLFVHFNPAGGVLFRNADFVVVKRQ